MSAYNQVDTVCFQFADDLIAALKDIYQNVEFHDTPQNLYGYQGDKRSVKAEIIVRRHNISSASNDLGFVKGPDGKYRMIVSEYDASCQVKPGEIIKRYSENVIKNKMKGKYRILGKSVKDGKQQIKLQMLR